MVRFPIFISYSHKDREKAIKVKSHLSSLENDGLADIWIDSELRAGDSEEWEKKLLRNLQKAKVFVVLLSDAFAASPYCQKKELPEILKRKKNGDLVYLVHLRPYSMEDALKEYQVLPGVEKAVSDFRNADQALKKIVDEIRKDIKTNMPEGGPARPEFEHLPHLFDRTNQRDCLAKLCDRRSRQPRRPMVFIVSGPKDEHHTGFHFAVSNEFLPRELGMRQPTHYIPANLPKDANFAIRMKSLSGATSSKPEDIAKEFPMGSLTYLSFCLREDEWNETLIEQFLRYWHAFPNLNTGRKLCVGISIQSKRISQEALLKRFPPKDYEPPSGIDGAVVESGLHFDVMKDLKPPDLSDNAADTWARERNVLSVCGSGQILPLIEEVERVFKKQSRIPMEELAGHLRSILERLP